MRRRGKFLLLGRAAYFTINNIPFVAIFFTYLYCSSCELVLDPFIPIMQVATISVFFLTSLYRLRDCGFSSRWMLAVMFPISAPIMFFYLCFKKGQPLETIQSDQRLGSRTGSP